MAIVDIPTIAYPPYFGAYGTSATLDAAEEFVVQVIRFPKTGTLRRVGLRFASVNTGYTIVVSLEKVGSTVAQPVATTNAAKTLYTTGSESAQITSGLTSDTVNYIEINGSTGVSVTAGDLVAITVRLIAVTGIGLNVSVPASANGMETYNGSFYSATYLGGTWANVASSPVISLIYSDGFCPLENTTPPCNASNLLYNSASTYPYTGIRVSYPFKCRVTSMRFHCDVDGDCEVIVYDSDEYTVMSGPISMSSLQRGSTGARWMNVIFPTKLTFEADTNYRVIVRPTTTTNIFLTGWSLVDDATYQAIDSFIEKDRVIMTQRATAPSSGDHTWVDTVGKYVIQLTIDGLDAGGVLTGPGMNGGING